jgi:signal transduction histidine kinase
MRGVTPADLAPEQLMETLADVVDRFQRETGINARFIRPFDRLDLPSRSCREVTRIVQEALVNVRKHSGARNVSVRLTAIDGHCRLSIDDDGRGFPYADGFVSQSDLTQATQRPRIIQERVRLLGGELNVESDPVRGARVEISFPLATHASRG